MTTEFAAIFLSASSPHLARVPETWGYPYNKRLIHAAPMCELPFDAYQIAGNQVRENMLFRNDVLRPKLLLSFGRP